MRLDFTLETRLPDTYRSNRVRSLFNVTPDQAAQHRVQVDLPLDEKPWSIGVVVGPSGSGKTSVGRRIFGDDATYHEGFDWSPDLPIVEAIGPGAEFDDVTGALSAVGLGTVPSWLRPYRVLSRGEQFRADLARILIDRPERIVVDEFTSVVDRQVAVIGAQAFAKAWRRHPTPGQAVLLTPHYDVLPWLQPDWVLDTKDWAWTWGWLQRRPPIELEVVETDWSSWHLFEPHHYLKLPRMVAARNYVGLVDGEPVVHVAVSTLAGRKGGSKKGVIGAARLCRLVVMPEWQGAGVGMRFLEWVAEEWYRGRNRYGVRLTGIIHTSHPGLVAALRRSPKWVQISAHGLGSARTSVAPLSAIENRAGVPRRVVRGEALGSQPGTIAYEAKLCRSAEATKLAATIRAGGPGAEVARRELTRMGLIGTAYTTNGSPIPSAATFGGHLRAVQGFRYVGDRT